MLEDSSYPKRKLARSKTTLRRLDEDLKMEKAHNKKYGVEITETLPFPEFDSGVPQEDEEDNKGNK
jgi:hypothetical protein